MTKTTVERITVLETKLDTVIEQQKTITYKLDKLTNTFATIAHLEEVEHKLYAEIKEIKGKRWVQNTLSAILGSVLTILIAYFINDIVR